MNMNRIIPFSFYLVENCERVFLGEIKPVPEWRNSSLISSDSRAEKEEREKKSQKATETVT